MFPDNVVGYVLSAIYFGIPFISLVIGIAAIITKRNIPIGIALCVPAVVFSVSIIRSENWGYQLLPLSNAYAGVLLIIAGILERKKREDKLKPSLPIALILIGMFCAAYYPATLVTHVVVGAVRFKSQHLHNKSACGSRRKHSRDRHQTRSLSRNSPKIGQNGLIRANFSTVNVPTYSCQSTNPIELYKLRAAVLSGSTRKPTLVNPRS